MKLKGISGLVAGLLMGLSLGAGAAEPVNINQASAAELAAALNGIGPVKAQEIVRYREQNGPFKSADDLLAVKGVGQALLARNRELILPVAASPAE
ncbi:helix-hairpin-helix domain-containing protein [Motiliproteus sp. SC1-56]|uniref:ComEA family DNA-binding protein n=1 Tax=Motiliproteus sp. SC1-56 TaxID=2799565 RepID=UPI001A8DC1BA